jgi:hypothetical protein
MDARARYGAAGRNSMAVGAMPAWNEPVCVPPRSWMVTVPR